MVALRTQVYNVVYRSSDADCYLIDLPDSIINLRMSHPLVFDVTETDFSEKVLEASRSRPVIVDFWADWCPPCRVLTPVLERVTHSLRGEVLLAKVEVDDNMRLAGRYQLRGFPTVILFVRGEEVGRFSGARSELQVRVFLSGHLSGTASVAVAP